MADDCATFFFFNDTATTEIYTLSLHDALPILRSTEKQATSWDELPEDIKNTYDKLGIPEAEKQRLIAGVAAQDRKSTRLNSSHANISYAVFCLKKKKPTLSQSPHATIAPHFFL